MASPSGVTPFFCVRKYLQLEWIDRKFWVLETATFTPTALGSSDWAMSAQLSYAFCNANSRNLPIATASCGTSQALPRVGADGW